MSCELCNILCMSSWRPDVPYNDLPAPPPVAALETPAVLKAAIGARTALARLDQAASSMPNPAILINTIPLLEAQASSEIENVVTTTDALFKHAQDESGADAATRETLRYRTAMRVGYDLVKTRGVTTNTAAAVCTTIKGVDMAVRTLPGTRVANSATGAPIYSPPEGRALLDAKLTEWEQFVHAQNGLDPLVMMAAAHYQFEAIHPFADGNGRTGRILNVLILVESGLLEWPVLYLSRYFIDTKEEYYSRLLAVSARGEWEEWLLYVLRGVEITSTATLTTIAHARSLQDRYALEARTALSASVDVGLIAALFEQPYARIGTVMERCNVSRPTATKWLRSLARAGLLVELKSGRELLFINHRFLELLTR